MTTTFQRQANRLLADAGYEFVCANGSGHEVWRLPGRPDIHVPGSPSGGRDSMLARVRRAIRKGTALTPPSGQETDMPAKVRNADRPMSERLVALASSKLVAQAEDKRKRREKNDNSRKPPMTGYMDEVAKWVERCLNTHGRISGSDFRAAAEALEIIPPELSAGRTKAKAASYRQPGMTQHETWTDYTKNLPADAMVFGGRKKTAAPKAAKSTPLPPKETEKEPEAQPLPPPDAEHVGRRLERGGLTDEEHAEAERRMREGHLRAEEERQAILSGRSVQGPDAVAGENGHGPKSQLDIAMQLLREAALADTHAITPADIVLLRGHQDTLLRCADDMRGVAASITSILVRVQAGLTAEGVPAV